MVEKLVVGGIETNCYIVEAETGGAIIIDPGDEAPRIIAKLDECRWQPRYIMLTHGHFDHLAAVPALIAHYAAKGISPQIAVHQDDAKYLGSGAYQEHCRCFAAATGGDVSFVDMLWEDMPPPALMLKEGSQIEQFTVLGLCGHSPGSSGFYDEKSKVLFSGDTLFNNGVGRTDLPDSDGQKIKQSLARLFLLPPDTKVFPGHGRATAIGVESERIILD